MSAMAEGKSLLDPSVFLAALESYATLMDKNAGRLDAVNVYPVPDYDTGSNLRSTVTYALRRIDPNPVWSALAPSVARGTLMSCRGNSGIIFSVAIRGLVDALAGGSNLSEALRDCS